MSLSPVEYVTKRTIGLLVISLILASWLAMMIVPQKPLEDVDPQLVTYEGVVNIGLNDTDLMMRFFRLRERPLVSSCYQSTTSPTEVKYLALIHRFELSPKFLFARVKNNKGLMEFEFISGEPSEEQVKYEILRILKEYYAHWLDNQVRRVQELKNILLLADQASFDMGGAKYTLKGEQLIELVSVCGSQIQELERLSSKVETSAIDNVDFASILFRVSKKQTLNVSGRAQFMKLTVLISLLSVFIFIGLKTVIALVSSRKERGGQ